MHHGSCQGGEKINMVLNIHYLRLSVGWEAPGGDFNDDEVVIFFFLHCVILTVALDNNASTTARNSSAQFNLDRPVFHAHLYAADRLVRIHWTICVSLFIVHLVRLLVCLQSAEFLSV